MALFYGWGSAASRLVPLRGGSLHFTTKFPDIPDTHFIDLGMMKGWVDLGATPWFWTWDLWNGNPTPKPIGHGGVMNISFTSVSRNVTTDSKEIIKQFLKFFEKMFTLKLFLCGNERMSVVNWSDINVNIENFETLNKICS